MQPDKTHSGNAASVDELRRLALAGVPEGDEKPLGSARIAISLLADRLEAVEDAKLIGHYQDAVEAASVLPNPHIRIRELEDALAPFADPRSWHFNYDGSGIIFQPEGDFYESQIEKRIDLAKEVMRRANAE